MKICRFDDNRVGVVQGGGVFDVTGALDVLPAHRYPFPLGDQMIANLAALRPRMEELAHGAPVKPATEVKFLSPVANPTKIIGTPQNYELHVREATADHQISGGRARRKRASSHDTAGWICLTSLIGRISLREPCR